MGRQPFESALGPPDHPRNLAALEPAGLAQK